MLKSPIYTSIFLWSQVNHWSYLFIKPSCAKPINNRSILHMYNIGAAVQNSQIHLFIHPTNTGRVFAMKKSWSIGQKTITIPCDGYKRTIVHTSKNWPLLTFLEHLVCARHNAECSHDLLYGILSWILGSSVIFLSSPFYRWESWGIKKLNNSLKVIYLKSGKNRIQIQVCLGPMFLNHFIGLPSQWKESIQ